MTMPQPRRRIAVVRRIIVAVIIVAFSVAALGGIVVLLGASLGETAARVIGTTATVGAFSVAVLCCAALVGRRMQAFGYTGAAVSAVSAVLCVVLIWRDDAFADDALFKAAWTGVAGTAALSLASLLLLLADRRRAAVRVGLAATLVLFAVVLGMTVYLIWWGEHVRSDAYGRVLGIAAILAALGAVVVPVLSLLLPDAGRASRAQLPAELAEALLAEAQRRGIDVADLVAPVLNRRPDPVSAPADSNTIEG